jgi:uncharacterized membrane protein
MTISSISGKEIPTSETVLGKDIREQIFQLIQNQYPGFNRQSILSLEELNQFRRLYLTQLIQQEKGEMAAVDLDVLKAIRENAVLTENIEPIMVAQLTVGEKLSDKIAAFGGSWTFIIAFFSFLLVWMAVNVFALSSKAFDPYPFILLNLILSCIAAIQAPIIMMSQNRQEAKDRQRAEQDYKVNLKAELEIKLLSEKIDHLIIHQNKKLLEIQEVQIDYLEDLLKKMGHPGKDG